MLETLKRFMYDVKGLLIWPRATLEEIAERRNIWISIIIIIASVYFMPTIGGLGPYTSIIKLIPSVVFFFLIYGMGKLLDRRASLKTLLSVYGYTFIPFCIILIPLIFLKISVIFCPELLREEYLNLQLRWPPLHMFDFLAVVNIVVFAVASIFVLVWSIGLRIRTLQIIFKRMTLFRALGTIVLSSIATLVLCHLFEPIRETLPIHRSSSTTKTSSELATKIRLTPVREEEILLIRKGNAYGAFIPLRSESTGLFRKKTTFKYQWYFRTDGKGMFCKEDAGKFEKGTSISYTPQRISRSGTLWLGQIDFGPFHGSCSTHPHRKHCLLCLFAEPQEIYLTGEVDIEKIDAAAPKWKYAPQSLDEVTREKITYRSVPKDQIILVRKGSAHYGIIVPIECKHRRRLSGHDVLKYKWYYRGDAKGTFTEEDRRLFETGIGKVNSREPISFGPFNLNWKGSFSAFERNKMEKEGILFWLDDFYFQAKRKGISPNRVMVYLLEIDKANVSELINKIDVSDAKFWPQPASEVK